MKTGVYKITFLPDGRVYVGATSKTLKGRWVNHKSSLRKNSHHNPVLQKLWNEFGADSFEFAVLELCETRVLLEREQHWINTLKAYSTGLNLSPTAGSQLGFTQRPESRRKISEGGKRRYLDSKERAKQSLIAKTVWKRFRAKISKAVKKARSSPEQRKKSSDITKKLWSDPAFRRKMLEARKRRKDHEDRSKHHFP